MSQWTQIGANTMSRADRSPALVTLLEGATFCISEGGGDIRPDTTQGFFFRDTRFISRWELHVDGELLEPVASTSEDPYSATFVSREHPHAGRADSTLVVTRRRAVGLGFREDIEVHNFDRHLRRCQVELRVDADFAALFDVKRGHVSPQRWGELGHRAENGQLHFDFRHDGVQRGVEMTFTGEPDLLPSLGIWTFDLVPHGAASICIEVRCVLDRGKVQPRHLCGEPIERSYPAQRFAAWREGASRVVTSYRPLEQAVSQGAADLLALRMVDPDRPEHPIVAAGAPWYMTLFGRDSILAAQMAMIVDPGLGLGVAQTLARFQGTGYDGDTEEAPGRILHEMRFGTASSPGLEHGDVYFGTVDATPLFVMLLGELWHWGAPRHELTALLPAADRALEWITQQGDVDGDGFVEYRTDAIHGLVNQGWKDSWDGVTDAGGLPARGPVALCEVQGYVYAADLARAVLAHGHGDGDAAAHWEQLAGELKERFNDAFWLGDRQAYALALDGDKRPVDAVASNMGHCLWTGIVDDDRAPAVARWLVSDELFSGWGIRTLASSMGAYNPISYHNGSVWPHDNALCIAGLMRYGFVDEAHRVTLALLDLAAHGNGRLPELVAGIDRGSVPAPVPYPTSCSPQAWAAAAPLSIVRSLLGFHPDVTGRRVHMRPVLPTEIADLRVTGLMLGDHEVTIDASHDGVDVDGLPSGFDVIDAR